MRLLPSAPRRRCQLSSNVRPHNFQHHRPSRKCACRRVSNSHKWCRVNCFTHFRESERPSNPKKNTQRGMCCLQSQRRRFASPCSTIPLGIESQLVEPPPSKYGPAPSASSAASEIRNYRDSHTFTLSIRSGRGIVFALPRVYSLIVQTVRPNPSLNRTRYGRQRKPGVRRQIGRAHV